MFRDPSFYKALRERVVPLLRTYPKVRIWHAGCASGEEAYSFAIVLEEEGLYDRCHIYATDMNETVLARAVRSSVPEDSVSAPAYVPAERLPRAPGRPRSSRSRAPRRPSR